MVAVLSALVLVPRLGQPAQPIWDEAYYLTSTQRYLERTAQFASHPPLGLMLIAAGALVVDGNRDLPTHRLAETKSVKGEDVSVGYSYWGLRAASVVFGILGAALFFRLALVLNGGRLGAAQAFANLYIFDNALAVQFRAGHLDAFQSVFLLAALLVLAVASRRVKPRIADALAFGVLIGLAAMVRLNAVVLAPIGLLLPILAWRGPKPWRAAGARVLALVGGGLAAVAVVMTIHVAVAPLPPMRGEPAGARDTAFVSPTYRDFLEGKRSLSPAVVWAAGSDYRRFIAADFAGTPKADPNGSSPLGWPLSVGAINYRWDSDGRTTRYLQLVGNPAGWAIGLLGMLLAAGLVCLRRGLDDDAVLRRRLMLTLLAGWTMFMTAHLLLAQQRVLYLYHYFPGLLISWALAILAFEEACARWPAVARRRMPLLAAATGAVLLGFLAYAPFTYHRPLTHAGCAVRTLLGPHVADCR
ncbi:phospholipid carrier-dependent glycosyltransferase [Caulobacter hibisci]|uniref:Polyprenol-phosphate-mannose--protein mannosyltransferase n=1 Tax=Caulobacter hibisci TaxID=2035993 RepID=A0ABS0ST77_9CAUL|nr:phospholipid carrier-dependent glycosyltransferase [Caulobacter hibisci]MBI1682865.1 phospholipid carrier-dependent glycosyltransferase [Caulobacter hibisci]